MMLSRGIYLGRPSHLGQVIIGGDYERISKEFGLLG